MAEGEEPIALLLSALGELLAAAGFRRGTAAGRWRGALGDQFQAKCGATHGRKHETAVGGFPHGWRQSEQGCPGPRRTESQDARASVDPGTSGERRGGPDTRTFKAR